MIWEWRADTPLMLWEAQTASLAMWMEWFWTMDIRAMVPWSRW